MLVLDAENGQDIALQRLRQLGATPVALEGRLRYSTEPLSLDVISDRARLRATLDEHRPELVVLDTMASHAPAAEADTESMAKFLGSVWAMCQARDVALLLLHHLRKSLQGARMDDALDSLRGSGHLAGAAHRVWLLQPLQQGVPHFVLHDVKARQFPVVAPTRLRVIDAEPGETGPATRIDVEGVDALVERGYDTYLADVLVFVDAHGGRPVTTKDLVHLGLNEGGERSCKGWLKRALTAGVLAQPKRGLWTRAQAPLPSTDDDETED